MIRRARIGGSLLGLLFCEFLCFLYGPLSPILPSPPLSYLEAKGKKKKTNMLRSVFLGTAAYLIFGSWLNYNRYGARGWDLVPHGDTIRDIPYLLKDWTRRVLNTVQGSGSRGGYSAV